MMKDLCITQDSKSASDGLRISRGVGRAGPLRRMSVTRLQQEEPGLAPLEDVRNPRVEQGAAGSTAQILASGTPLGESAHLSGLSLSPLDKTKGLIIKCLREK